MFLRIIAISVIILFGGLSSLYSQALDISSGGAPTITGANGGSVTGSSSLLNDLSVTINFGEISPLNTNNIVKVTVPIAIRSNRTYRVTATYTGATNANPQALQRSDIGFGIQNMRRSGNQARVCNRSPHIFYSPFDNDPALNASVAGNGRVQYISDLADVTTSTTIITGPRLSNGGASRGTNDAWIFDAIFVVTPQFYANGTTTGTVTFTISAGPSAPC